MDDIVFAIFCPICHKGIASALGAEHLLGLYNLHIDLHAEALAEELMESLHH